MSSGWILFGLLAGAALGLAAGAPLLAGVIVLAMAARFFVGGVVAAWRSRLPVAALSLFLEGCAPLLLWPLLVRERSDRDLEQTWPWLFGILVSLLGAFLLWRLALRGSAPLRDARDGAHNAGALAQALYLWLPKSFSGLRPNNDA